MSAATLQRNDDARSQWVVSDQPIGAGKPKGRRLLHTILDRWNALEPLLAFRLLIAAGYKPTIHLRDGSEVHTLTAFVHFRAGELSVSHMTLWRLLTKYKKLGIVGLVNLPYRSRSEKVQL